jgi:threonylcarbamoyladenosine tRNA methylthiotransferase MtaB
MEVPFPDPADLYIVNTCTVTAVADEKCRKEIRRAHRANRAARLIVTGCAARTEPERFAPIPGVTAVLARERIAGLTAWLGNGAEPEERDVFTMEISRFAGHTRAFLKIEDGCDAGCAYCIVPHARGRVRSRPLQAVKAEARRLADAGHIEIVLTGIHLGFYGRDLDGEVGVPDAVRALLETPGVQRVRLSSLEALELSEDLLDIAASDPRLCPHFHLPLQSGDDAILKAMRRRYTVGEFLRVLDRVRLRLDRPSFTTDVMVGFPGENDAQCENTLRVCRQAGFSRIHIFPFSPRPGTLAAAMPDPVRSDVIHDREGQLENLAAQLAVEYKRQFFGEIVLPLAEQRRDRESGLLTGWTERYLKTIFKGPDGLKGKIVAVKVESATAELIRGSVQGHSDS